MTLQERIEDTKTRIERNILSEYTLAHNQIAIMEALIRIEAKLPKEAPFLQEQLNEPAKWIFNQDFK